MKKTKNMTNNMCILRMRNNFNSALLWTTAHHGAPSWRGRALSILQKYKFWEYYSFEMLHSKGELPLCQ